MPRKYTKKSIPPAPEVEVQSMTDKEWRFMLLHLNDVINDGNRLVGEEDYIEIPEVYFKHVDEDDPDVDGLELHICSSTGRMTYRLMQNGTYRVTTSLLGKNSRPPGFSKFLYLERYKKIYSEG